MMATHDSLPPLPVHLLPHHLYPLIVLSSLLLLLLLPTLKLVESLNTVMM